MKKLKRNEIIIYAIAIMLVAAGYFNYSTFENNTETQPTYSESVEKIENEYANTGDAVLVNNNEIAEENIQKEETTEKKEENKTKENSEDYYSTSKIEREKMFAEMVSNYEKILNNSNTNEMQKSIATEEIKKINNTKNAIMICENLILTKGFNNCILFVNEKNVNIVVNIDGGLKPENVAQIQNIISREINTEIENIHITEK